MMFVMNTAVRAPARSGPSGLSINQAPRWARWAAHSAALTPLPSALWRLALAMGFTLGYTDEGFHEINPGGFWGPAYLVFLSLLTEAAALLTLGLVHRWGEVVPRWVPFVGGRLIPRRAVLIPAWTGVAILTVLWTPFAAWWAIRDTAMTESGHFWIGFLYLPLVAWAPLLAGVTLSYQRRSRRQPGTR